MDLTNTTENTYVLPGPPDSDVLVLGPLATVTVDDGQYEADDNLATQVNGLVESGAATVASAPAGFPRNTDSGSSGGETIKLEAGATWTVLDSAGQKVFEIRDDGTVHTHGAVVADL